MCTFALAAAMALLAGCAGRTSSVEGEDKADLNGYYEIHREGKLYVLGTIRSVDQVMAGKLPTSSVPSHTRRGEPIVFEDDASGLATRLMAEYDRRHGID